MREARRRIPLDGAWNVRDLGGYPTADGGSTPYGRFFRGDDITALEEPDKEALYRAGIRTIVDLRTPGECERRPNGFEGWRDVQVLHCSLLGADLDGFIGFLRSLGENYCEMIRRDSAYYVDLFALLAEAVGRGGVLFHCSMGKDRTGVTAALLLSLAGVADVDIIADYALTDIYTAEKVRRILANFPDIEDDSMFRARAESMEQFTACLRETYGGARGYLTGIGVPAATLDAIWG